MSTKGRPAGGHVRTTPVVETARLFEMLALGPANPAKVVAGRPWP